jgi:TonB family protein
MASVDENPVANLLERAALTLVGVLAVLGVALAQDDANIDPATGDSPDPPPLASERLPENGDSAEPESPPVMSRLEASIELASLMDEGDYAAAVDVALRFVELTETEFGADSRETASAYNTLAEAQRLSGMYPEAESSYLEAVDIYRNIDGPFGASLIEPTTGLGDNFYDSGDYVSAVAAYDEARSVQRRVYGVLSEEQVELLDKMTDSFMRMGMSTEANDQQLSALMLAERNYPEASVEVLEAIYKYARWLRSVGRFVEERLQYERAIRIIRDEYGKDSALLVRPYREIGNSFRASGFEQGRGASALQIALELVEEQEPTDPMALARVLLDIGDWKTAFGSVDAGGEEYLRAWRTLDAVESGSTLQEAWFGGRRPVFVYTERMSDRGLSQDADALPGSVVVKFDIDNRGRTENVMVIDSDPPGFKDEAAERAIRQSRFRPKISDGVLVGARNMGVQITFRYLPSEEENGNSG